MIFSQATNPVEDIEFPNTITTRARRAASKEELDRIFYEMELNHLVHAIKFVLHTGMRPEPEEVCGMPDSSSYDYSSGKFVIDMVITRFGEIRSEGKSENAIREVPLSTLALQDISNQDEMKRRRGLISTFLFCNAYGSKLTPKTLSDTFRKYARQAGSNLSLYELRHTYVSIMDGQVSDKALKASVGHNESMTTQKHTVTF